MIWEIYVKLEGVALINYTYAFFMNMIKKYIVWWSIPIILIGSIYVDINSSDVMFPLILFTGMICCSLLIMGFVYYHLEIKKTGDKLDSIIVNFCLGYTLFYPFVIVLLSAGIGQGENWISLFFKSNFSLTLFLIVQVISILMLITISFREQNNRI